MKDGGTRLAFSAPAVGDRAVRYLKQSLASGVLAGDGPFTQRCHDHLRQVLGSPSLLTHSCTAALEMAAILTEVGPGDEVIMPSYTFVSTANAFVLRGAVPVFVDIRPDTLNLDERLLEQALSPKTKVVVPVHYAGVACEMDTILAFARSHDLFVVEDAAQCYGARYNGKSLGTLGDLGCLSFHVTKNVVSGEGGALVVNNDELLLRAQIVREKGTNRTQFLNGDVARYEWLDLGSSYLPSDLVAAVLLSQLEEAETLNASRRALWDAYHRLLAPLEARGLLTRPHIPDASEPNAHLYYVLLSEHRALQQVQLAMAQSGLPSPSHYVPLHSAPAGRRYGRVATTMDVTDRTAASLLRLPLHPTLAVADVERVVSGLEAALI